MRMCVPHIMRWAASNRALRLQCGKPLGVIVALVAMTSTMVWRFHSKRDTSTMGWRGRTGWCGPSVADDQMAGAQRDGGVDYYHYCPSS